MKYLFIILFCINVFVSCKSVRVDYFYSHKNLSATEILYITNIEVNSNYSMAHLVSNLNRLLMFALQKNAYTVTSYFTEPGKADNYRYHILMKAYVNQIGNTIDRDYSVMVFFTLYDTKLKKEIINVRTACNSCDLLNVDDQVTVMDAIVSRFDSLIKK